MKEFSRADLHRALKRLLLVVGVFNGIIGFYIIKCSFSPPDIYTKDFAQEYLMAKAILNGVNPYLPVTELARIWLTDSNYSAIKHPSLHPPLASLLCLPLSLLNYRQASLVWFAVELGCILAALLLVFRWLRKPIKPLSVLAILFLALGFAPVVHELRAGQLNACLLLLLIGSWMALREGKERLGGVLLGCVIALKWMAWPIIIFLIVRLKWKSIIAVAVVLSVTNLLAILVLGIEVWKDYYLKIAPSASYIRTFEYNLSASAFGLHMFSEMGWNHKLIPLWNSPTLALVSSSLITLSILLIGLGMALRASTFDTAFGLLTGVSILVSPVAWSCYLVLAAIPAVILVGRLSASVFPPPFSFRTLFLLCPVLVTLPVNGIIKIITGERTSEGMPIVTFIPGLLFMLPTISLIGLLWLVWRSDGVEFSHRDNDHRTDPLV